MKRTAPGATRACEECKGAGSRARESGEVAALRPKPRRSSMLIRLFRLIRAAADMGLKETEPRDGASAS